MFALNLGHGKRGWRRVKNVSKVFGVVFNTVKAAHAGRFSLDSRYDSTQDGPMPGSTTCAVVIPCFNEGASIAALVPAVREHLPRVIVVDDGSTDDTAALAEGAGAVVVGDVPAGVTVVGVPAGSVARRIAPR